MARTKAELVKEILRVIGDEPVEISPRTGKPITVDELERILDRKLFGAMWFKAPPEEVSKFIHTYTFVATKPIERTKKDAEGKIVTDEKGKAVKERIERKIEVHFESSAPIDSDVEYLVERVTELLVKHFEYQFIYEETNLFTEASSWSFEKPRKITAEMERDGIDTEFEIYDHTYSTIRGKISKKLPVKWWEENVEAIRDMLL